MTSPIELQGKRTEHIAELRMERDAVLSAATVTVAALEKVGRPSKAAPPAQDGPDQPTGQGKDLLEQLRRAATSQNERLAEANQRMQISIDESTGNIVVEVRNTVTGEVLRQIPTEEALRIARNIDQQTDMLTGVVVDRYE